MSMEKHFVTFLSPGTLVHEERTLPIESWSVIEASEMAHNIVERYSATPFGFQFSTRSRADNELDSKITATSSIFYLGGDVATLEEIEARNAPDEAILRDNMRSNDIKRVIVNRNSWKSTHILRDDDVVLNWIPRAKASIT